MPRPWPDGYLGHTLFGIDPFTISAAFDEIPRGAQGVTALLVALLVTSLFFGTMAYWSLRIPPVITVLRKPE